MIIKDSFNRSNNTNLNASNDGKELDGSPGTWQWTEVTGNQQITSNQFSAAAQEPHSTRAEIDINVEMYAQVVITTLATTGGYSQGVAVNFDASSNSFYLFELQGSDEAKYALYKVVNGTPTALINPTANAWSTPVTIKLVSQTSGSNRVLTLYINGNQVNQFTDTTSPLTGVRAGLAGMLEGNLMDSFEAGTLVVLFDISGDVKLGALPVENAKVILINKTDNQVEDVAATNVNGEFAFQGVEGKEYIVAVEYEGFS